MSWSSDPSQTSAGASGSAAPGFQMLDSEGALSVLDEIRQRIIAAEAPIASAGS